MRNLTIGDLKLGLRDLLGTHLSLLRATQTGSLYEKRLRAKQQALEAIPEPADRAAPLADELATKDNEHDGLGTAIHHLCLAVESHPKLAAGLKVAAKETRETFVPQLGVLRRPYADEAAAALDHDGDLPRLKPDLKMLAAPGGGTLLTWAQDFVQSGHALDALLRERANILSTNENAAIAAPLRSSTVGLLGRFREALRDEVEEEGSVVPKDYEAKLFAYIDQLATQRASATATEASATTSAEQKESAAPV